MTRSTDHVVLTNKGALKCNHCARTLDMPHDASPSVWSAMCKAFTKEHRTCKRPTGMRCTFCQSPTHEWFEHVNATCIHARHWPNSGDTGSSSMAIYGFFTTGNAPPDVWGETSDADAPVDPSDFGRCHRLLHAPFATGWRGRITEMAKYPRWAKLALVWDELEALYVEEFANGKGKEAPKLYARMQELRGMR